MKEESNKKRVFSGIQPTGNIHIGNYLGAIKHWVESQAEFDNIFCIVDLHAITVPQDSKTLREKIREVAGILLASGIDPEQSVLFIQSHISAHTELAWILNCLTPVGWIQRMTQYKEKASKQIKGVSVGLFDYPVLMAADILLYGTDLVPVGEDQKQHLEFARDMALRFNSLYGETFKLPEPQIPDVGARIMALDDPLKKMSKSDGEQGHAIHLLDPPDDIRSKILKATTDSKREICFDESRPGIYNLLVIYELFTQVQREVIEERFKGKGYLDFKRELAEILIENLRPLQSRFRRIMSDPDYLEDILLSGAEKIRPVAENALKVVKDRVGLG